MSNPQLSAPRFIERGPDCQYLGTTEAHGRAWDVYADGADLVVRCGHGYWSRRTVPFCNAVVFAGRGSEVWAAAVKVSDVARIAANDNATADMVLVRTHLRRRPRRAA